jgi:hypothetical protein
MSHVLCILIVLYAFRPGYSILNYHLRIPRKTHKGDLLHDRFYRIMGQRLIDELMTSLSVYVVLGNRSKFITFLEIDCS